MLVQIILFILLYVITKQVLSKFIKLQPSPFPALPIIGHLHLLKTPLHRTLSKLSNTYGPVLLLQLGARRVLVVSSPSAAEECLTKNDVVFANRPRLLAAKHFGYNYSSIIWSPYGDHWRKHRRISSVEILSTYRLQMLSSIRSNEIRSLVKRLFQGDHKDRAVHMKTAFFELTLNVMMRMIAGKRYYGENVVEVEAARQFQEIVKETFVLAGTSNMEDFLPVLKWLGVKGTEEKFIALQAKRDEFVQRLVDEYR